MTNEQNCGQYTIKDLKPVQPEDANLCEGCPIQKGSIPCYHQMWHSDNHCQKYFTNNNNHVNKDIKINK